MTGTVLLNKTLKTQKYVLCSVLFIHCKWATTLCVLKSLSVHHSCLLSHYKLNKLYVFNGIIKQIKNQQLGIDIFTVNSLHLFLDTFLL